MLHFFEEEWGHTTGYFENRNPTMTDHLYLNRKSPLGPMLFPKGLNTIIS
ncbi:hypothetical protein AAG747_27175 [Rapidithrix thailandica]|uniref:Uncharacterized protein n=1 Tax=Rapidithrix thailandica TaxID=413964 RepID=A0AAW9S5V7_9BACT